MKVKMLLIYEYLKRNQGKQYNAVQIGSYVNKKTKSCDRYYQCLSALSGSNFTGEEPAFTKWAKEQCIFNTIVRTVIKGKSVYQDALETRA